MNKRKLLRGILYCVLCLMLGPVSYVTGAESDESIENKYNSQELWLQRDDQPIYGVLCTPAEEQQKYPLVIVSHGLGTSADQTLQEAQFFAEHGFAAYAFDFCGGSDRSRSGSADGDMTKMSVLTEAADLSAVMDQLMGLDTIDNQNVFLLGMSQGGYVSAYVAAQRPEDVRALGLEYPAFACRTDVWNCIRIHLPMRSLM